MKKSILATIIMLVAIAAIVVFIFPSYQKLRVSQTNIKQKQQEFKDLTDYADQLQKVANQLKESETQLAKIDQSLLQSVYLPSVFQFFQTISSGSGVRMDSIDLGKEEILKENKNIVVQEVNLKISGDYSGLKNFLISLENNSRLVSMSNIRIIGETVSQDSYKRLLSTMELSVKVFSYQK